MAKPSVGNLKKSIAGRISQPPGVNQIAGDTTNDGSLSIKSEILRWIFSITGAALVYFIAALLVQATYHPDIEQLNKTAKTVLIEYNKAIPEPMEALLFRLGIIIVLSFLFWFYFLFYKSEWIRFLTEKPVSRIVSIIAVAALIALIFAAFAAPNLSDFGSRRFPPNPDDPGNNNFNFYFNEFFIGHYLWLYVLIVVPLIAAFFFLGLKKLNWDNSKPYRILTPVIGYTVTGAVVAAIIAMNIFSFPYSIDNKVDFNAVYYSMTQVYAGVPMLADGFTNTYGLYPHFLNPIFQVTGLSILKFSVVMSLLLGLSFVLNFYALKKMVSNQVILFAGFATMLFFSYLDRKLLNDFDCYFALFPIRYLAPSVLVFLASVYLFKPSSLKYWITLFVMASFILWNPELGMVCYISMVLFFVYHDFFDAEGNIAIRKISTHILAGVLVLPVVFYTYKLLIYAFYGSAPDLGLLWGTITVFSKVGFGLLPMALVHPWNLIALILIAGFTYSIMQWNKKAITPRAAMVFLLSLIGVGYLFYYQGRSHSVNLSVSSGFCILLLTIMGDELWTIIKNRNVLFLNAVFVVFLFLVSFSFIELVYNSDKIVYHIYQEEDKSLHSKEQRFVESNRDFILNNSVEGEKILVLTVSKYQSLYFDGNKRRSAFNPGLIDLFLNTGLDRFNNMVRDSSFSIFIEPVIFNYAFMQPALATMAASCELQATGKSMALVTKRKTKIPAVCFFNSPGQASIHRKYTDDSAGLRSRCNDAFGIAPVTLAPEFSVQALFYAKRQVYRDAVIAGNLDGAKGFVISNGFSSSDYFFIINGNEVKVPLPNNEWVYTVMNVFSDHMDVYLDGSLVASHPLSGPVLQSESLLCIGNLGIMHYYTGAIAEVAIENNAVGAEQVQKTWDEIKMVITK